MVKLRPAAGNFESGQMWSNGQLSQDRSNFCVPALRDKFFYCTQNSCGCGLCLVALAPAACTLQPRPVVALLALEASQSMARSMVSLMLVLRAARRIFVLLYVRAVKSTLQISKVVKCSGQIPVVKCGQFCPPNKKSTTRLCS